MQIIPAWEINDRNNWLFLRFHLLVFFPNASPLLPLMEMYSVFMIVHFQHWAIQNSSKHYVLVNFHNRIYRLKENGAGGL